MNDEKAIMMLRNAIRLKGMPWSTEKSYRRVLVQYMAFLRTVPAFLSSEDKFERYLTQRALQDISASTQNVEFNAILFFYRRCLKIELKDINALRAKRPATIRNAPSVEDTRTLLAHVQDSGGYPTRLIVKLLYGCGFRVTDPLNLRLRDVDVDHSRFIIRCGKGGVSGVVAIPCSLVQEIKVQTEMAMAVWARDGANGTPIKLPHRLDQKYPAARFSKKWAWLFPMREPCKDPRSGEIVRYRMLECNVQRAVKRACLRCDLEILPHELRHGYATHCLDRGTNMKALQEVLRHKNIQTTAGYCHADALSVKSPLDGIEEGMRDELGGMKVDASRPLLR